MADIFVSYKREDRERVEPLVWLLEAEGYSVWWDPTIIPGEEFAAVIREALDEAACVMACWSRLSVESFWVRDEAGIGRDRGMLIPVSIDGTEPPLGFRQFQSANLTHWNGDPDDPQIALVVSGVHRLVGEPIQPEVIPPPLPAIEYDIAREQAMARLKAEQAHWETIRKSPRKSDFEVFLAEYPEGHFAGPAHARLEQLEQREAGQSHVIRRGTISAGLIVLLLIGGLAALFSWTGDKSLNAKPPTSTKMATDPWHSVTDGSSFTVEMPGMPEYEADRMTTDGSSPHTIHRYSLFGSERVFSVGTFVFQDGNMSSPELNIQAGLNSVEKTRGMRWQQVKWLKHQGHTAAEAFASDDRYETRAYVVVKERQGVALYYSGPTGTARSPDAEQFIKSLRVW